MVEEPGILGSVDGHVAVLELNRPPHNYFDEDLLSELADYFHSLDQNPQVRAIVLAARGKSFCAGAVLGRPPPPGSKSHAELIYVQARRLFSVKKPVIAAIEGAAVGGGLGLALAADFRICGARARFSANFTALGFHPGFGLTVTLPRVVGADRAALLLLSARRIGGEEALEMGLITDLVEEGRAVEVAIEMARDIAAAAPLAVEATRATLREGLTEALSRALDRELAEQDRLKLTDDFKEGVAAARERRAPEFKRK